MCTEEFIRMMFMVDLYGNRGLDSRRQAVNTALMPQLCLNMQRCSSNRLHDR